MLIISLKIFAQTGKFGFVEIEMHKSRVLELLGKPNEESINLETGVDILLYGSYEFFFFDKYLIGIQNESLQYYKQNLAQFSNSIFRIDTWFMNGRKERTYKDVVSFLEKEKITYEEQIKHNIIFLYLPSGVSFDFHNHSHYGGTWNESTRRYTYPIIPKKEDYVLVGIRYHPPL
ncbi:MAG: hypothetical protein RL329_570 [Bacteroidota bacterium]|jgi:hypothetical protein